MLQKTYRGIGVIACMFGMLLALCSCSNAGNSEDIDAYKAKVAELEEQVELLQAQLNEMQSSKASSSGDSESATNVITFGQKVVIDDVVEFTLESCSWQDEIYPSNTSSAYSYYSDEADETYLVIRGNMTNLSGESYDIDSLQDSDIVVNGKYSFNIRVEAEEADGSSFSRSTKPLQTVNLIIYAGISDGVKEIFEDGMITFNVLNDPSRVQYVFHEEDSCKNVYTLKLPADAIL